MPIRIVCPSCSAALSVKDEFAGRAVKCPKCGGVIPPSAQQPAAPAAAPPPPPPPAPKKPAFEAADEPDKPAKSSPKIAGKPAPKLRDDEDDDRGRERDEDRPRKRRDEEDDEDRPRRKGSKERAAAKGDRDEEDSDGGRPGKRRRRDDDDDAPRGKKKGGGGGAGMILAILGGLFLVCCGGGGGLAYYLYTKAREKAEEITQNIENWNPGVNKANYDALKVGSTTRAQAETTLGTGKAPTDDEINTIYGWDKSSADSWKKYAAKNRALMWRNGDDYILVLLHPDARAESRVQIKEWKPKNPPGNSDGSSDDVMFVANYPLKKDGGPKPPLGKGLTPETKVKAEDLTREFKADSKAAAEKYVGKTFTVEGKLKDIEVVGNDTRTILEGLPGEGDSRVSCLMKGYLKLEPFNHSRGMLMRVQGRCVGGVGGTVSLTDCATTGFDPDRTPEVRVSDLIAAYRTSDTAGDGRFKGKQIRLELAEVEKLDNGSVTLVPFGKIPGGKAPAKKIRVEFDPAYKALYPKLKVGALVRMHGKCEGVRDGEIVVSDAWFGNVLERMK